MRDSLITFGLVFVNRALGIGVGIVLARYLGPIGKGYVAYAPIALEVVVTAMNGVSQAATYQYGRNGVPGGAVYAAMNRIVLAVSLPAAAIVALVAWLVPSQGVLIAAACALPFAVYVQAVTGILLGADRVSATNVQRTIMVTAANALTVLAVVAFRADYRVVLAVWVLSYVSAAVYSAFAVRPFVRDRSPATPAIIREQLTFGGKAGAAQLAGYVNMRIDVVIVSALLGAWSLGLYTLALGIGELLWQISQPMCMSAFPRIATGPEDEAAAFTAKLIRHVVSIMVPVGVVAFVVGPTLISAVYGPAFAAAGGALRWLLPGIVVYAVEIPLGYYLMVRMGRPGLIVAIQAASVVACAALTFTMAGSWWIEGAAFATSVTYCTVVLVKGGVFMHRTGIGLRELLVLRRSDIAALRRVARNLAGKLKRGKLQPAQL